MSALLLLFVVAVQAVRVDTVAVKSTSMNKEVEVVCVLPDKAVGKNGGLPCSLSVAWL